MVTALLVCMVSLERSASIAILLVGEIRDAVEKKSEVLPFNLWVAG